MQTQILNFGDVASKYPEQNLLRKAQLVFKMLHEEVLPALQQNSFPQAMRRAFAIANEVHLQMFSARIDMDILGGKDLVPLIGERSYRAYLDDADMSATGRALQKVLERGAQIPGFMSRVRSQFEKDAGWLGFALTPREFDVGVSSTLLGTWMEEAAGELRNLLSSYSGKIKEDLAVELRDRLILIKCAALMDTTLPNLSKYHSSGNQFGSLAALLNEGKEIDVRQLEMAAAYTAQLALSIKTSNC